MSRQAPHPKRTADVYTRTHHQTDDDHEDALPSTKKPRFDYRNPSTLAPDAPEEDDVLELDEIGKSAGVKRNAVNIDGYDSDSDNDNFDARAREKARREKASKEEDENDMFADLEEGDGDEYKDEVKANKKGVRFLDENEIEGQVSTSKSGGHVSADFTLGAGKQKRPAKDDDDDSSDEDESADEEERDRVGSDIDEEIGAGGKKKHAPKLDAFNMRSENEEGRFDETGNYVRKALDPDSVHDNWLEGVSKKEMKRAKEAQALREEEQRRRDRADEKLVTADLLGTLIRHLQVGETVLEALQRLNRGKPREKAVPKWKLKRMKGKQNGHGHGHGHAENGDSMDVDEPAAAVDPAETKRKEAVEAITGAAEQLMTRGDLEVYERERELLMRMYKRETGDDWVDERRQNEEEETSNDTSNETNMWEYHWADNRDGGQIHGPYDHATMKAWTEAGYFGDGFECRPAGAGEGDWSRTVVF
jgi:CD2 antigen cytoplasmic tail-binding protein 2